MKRLLDDYIFDDILRYEAHQLVYKPDDTGEIALGGIMGAAVLGALLADTDEGDERGVLLDTPEQRNAFFERYEREVRRDNGGLFTTEVQALSDAYIEITDTDYLVRICRNDRLFDLAFGLAMDYMQRLVIEQVGAHIYEAVPWRVPFAQWLFDAGWAEAQRRHLLAVNWTDPAAVYALARELQPGNEPDPAEPVFLFEGESAERLMNDYFHWLWEQVQAQTSMMPDAAVQLAQLRPEILEKETDWDFIKPELKDLAPDSINLFRKWMNQWTEFVTGKLSDSPQNTFPPLAKRPMFCQELFSDNVLSCPRENNYVEVCDYIVERCRYDEPFRTFYKTRTRVQLCEQLTAIFGWYVNPNHLGKRLKKSKK